MELLVKISLILLVGVLSGRVAKFLHLPYVTGYLLGGLLIGPSLFGIITDADVDKFEIINDVALSAIAFSIGSEFQVEHLLDIGKNVIIITLFQALMTVFVVFITSYIILSQSFEFSILLAAIAAATAPAATTMVIRQYKADGPLTQTILPVVAIDDAICVICFGIAVAVSKISLGVTGASLFQMISYPILEIIGSIILGFLMGFLLTFLARKTNNQEELLVLILAFIIASAGLAYAFHLSPLLTGMMLGGTITNLMHNFRRAFTIINNFTPPIYLFFFTLAGCSLHLSILGKLGIIGVGYIIARAVGKIGGAAIGAKTVGSPDVITKYLGFGLLPQAGVAIGLSMVARQQFPGLGLSLTTIVLGGVLVYELIGPISAKYAIKKAGEINKMNLPSEDQM